MESPYIVRNIHHPGLMDQWVREGRDIRQCSPAAHYYVIARDRASSGKTEWNGFTVEILFLCRSHNEARDMKRAIEARRDMDRVSVIVRPPSTHPNKVLVVVPRDSSAGAMFYPTHYPHNYTES